MNIKFSKRSLPIVLATLGPVGYLSKAPGTFGTFAAIPLFYIFSNLTLLLQLILVLIIITVAVWGATYAGEYFQKNDDPKIVIDEVAGYIVATYGISFNIWTLVISFFLFRLFDILKIYPINLIDRRWRTGVGVVTDDVVAGIFTNIIIQFILLLFPTIG